MLSYQIIWGFDPLVCGVSKRVWYCQWLLESQSGLAGAEHSRLSIPSGNESRGAAAKGNAHDESSDRGSGARNECPQGEQRLGKQSKSEPHAAPQHGGGFQLAASPLGHSGTTWVPLVRIQQPRATGTTQQAPPKARAPQNSAPHTSRRESPHPNPGTPRICTGNPEELSSPWEEKPSCVQLCSVLWVMGMAGPC